VTSRKARAGEFIRQCLPASLKARVPVRFRAWARAKLLGEPWPDLAIRHPLFRTADYKALRKTATTFDRFRKPYKPPIERGHQASYFVAQWFTEASVNSVFHAGYSNGRYLFYLLQRGIDCGGTDLELTEAPENEVPGDVFGERVLRRLLRVDFFGLGIDHLRSSWDKLPIDVLFTEATFETLVPWRKQGFSVLKYRAARPEVLHGLLYERLPAKLGELRECFRNMVFIEPEPSAGGAGEVFARCARRLPDFEYSVWRFRPPFSQLFRLSPSEPTLQAVYAYTRDSALLSPLRAYCDRL
jgi:hypothetical protein